MIYSNDYERTKDFITNSTGHVDLILSFIHSILAFMSVLIMKAQAGLHYLYKQIIGVEDNENTQEL